MGGIIWLIVVIYIVTKSINNAKQNSREQTRPNVPRTTAPPQHREQRSVPQPMAGGMWSTGQQRPPAQRNVSNKKQHVPQQTHRRTAPAAPQEHTILQKAMANTAERAAEAVPAAQKAASVGGTPMDAPYAFDTTHLMEQVQDLMVKGYSGNLEFERDFLAEATDMLNRMYR